MSVEQEMAEVVFDLYWTGHFNKAWGGDGRVIKGELEAIFKEINEKRKNAEVNANV